MKKISKFKFRFFTLVFLTLFSFFYTKNLYATEGESSLEPCEGEFVNEVVDFKQFLAYYPTRKYFLNEMVNQSYDPSTDASANGQPNSFKTEVADVEQKLRENASCVNTRLGVFQGRYDFSVGGEGTSIDWIKAFQGYCGSAKPDGMIGPITAGYLNNGCDECNADKLCPGDQVCKNYKCEPLVDKERIRKKLSTGNNYSAVPSAFISKRLPGEPAGVGKGSFDEDYFTKKFLPNLTKILLGIIAMQAVIFIIIGGVQMMFAGASNDSSAVGRKTITWSIIGLLISITAYAIVAILNTLFTSQ